MGVIGVTLIFGAVVFFIARPPHHLLAYFRSLWIGGWIRGPPQPPRLENGDPGTGTGKSDNPVRDSATDGRKEPPAIPLLKSSVPELVPPPPSDQADHDDTATTPKATPALPQAPVPTFSLSDSDSDPPAPQTSPKPPAPPQPTPMAPPPRPGSMPPPPRPGLMAPPPPPTPSRLPALTQSLPSASSLSRSTLPIPNRGPASSSSSLGPPPTNTAKPTRSRLVALAPGHSPMDWARISGPNSDLRNLPADTPYLRVSPSMLKKRNGRKGNDAWSVYAGRVYNVTPYIDFHPGGRGELLRGAGKDATKLFMEVHPWVNYETMLAACLVGVAVEEGEGTEDVRPGEAEQGSRMDEMD